MLTEWCDTTWYQWMMLHDRANKPFGVRFPSKRRSDGDRLGVHLDIASGRLASPAREKVEFYEELDEKEL